MSNSAVVDRRWTDVHATASSYGHGVQDEVEGANFHFGKSEREFQSYTLVPFAILLAHTCAHKAARVKAAPVVPFFLSSTIATRYSYLYYTAQAASLSSTPSTVC